MTKRTRAVAMEAAKEGVTPLEYMLSVLRNPEATESDKRWAAEKSAPYIHPRLSNVDVQGSMTVSDASDEQLDRAIELAAAQAGVAVVAQGKRTTH